MIAVAQTVDFSPFVSWFNHELGFSEAEEHSVGDEIAYAFQRHFEKGEDYDDSPVIRASNLGKPATLLALNKLGYVEPPLKGRVKFACYLGDVWESALEVFLKMHGYEIVATQDEIEWEGISGHFDFIVNDGKQDVLVEAKSLSEGYSRVFMREPNDDRGYVTQLAIYTRATQLPGAWLCFNKGSGEMYQVLPNDGQLDAALYRGQKVIERMEEVHTVADVLKAFRPPPPVPEVYRKNQTGLYKLPQSLAWSPFASALYKITHGVNGYNKPTTYVDSIADAEHLEQELEFLVATGALVKRDV